MSLTDPKVCAHASRQKLTHAIGFDKCRDCGDVVKAVNRHQLHQNCRILAQMVYPHWSNDNLDAAADELLDTLDALGEDTDPQSMGWVDDRGRP